MFSAYFGWRLFGSIRGSIVPRQGVATLQSQIEMSMISSRRPFGSIRGSIEPRQGVTTIQSQIEMSKISGQRLFGSIRGSIVSQQRVAMIQSRFCYAVINKDSRGRSRWSQIDL